MVPPSVQRIDKFDVLRRIGRGGMGSVYLGRDPDIDRLVAIKLLHEGFDEDDMRGRFTAEARSASALRHTNIVTIFQTGTFLDRPFIVMEYVEGETFADIIASERPVPIVQKLQLLDQLLAGLQYAHTKGIIHRDIKPSNVMVDTEGVVRVLDFGIARFGQGGGLTRSGVVLGTLNYMSPEQLSGGAIDARADIFAAGLVAYELLTSKPAFPQAFPEVLRKISYEDPLPMEQLCPGIDPALVGIVARCYAKHPGERYPDCGAVRRELDAVRQTIGASAEGVAPFVVNVNTGASSPRPSTSAGTGELGSEIGDKGLGTGDRGSGIGDQVFGETLRIETRRPPTRPGTNSEATAPELPMTLVIPRGAPATVEPPASVEPPIARPTPSKPVVSSRPPFLMIGSAAVVVLLIAGGIWLMTRGGGSDVSKSSAPVSPIVETRAPEPTPPAAAPPVAAPPPVSATPDTEAVDRAREKERLLEELKTSRDRASAARRRATSANGRGTQAYAVGDVRVGDGDRFAKLGQLDEAVRAFSDAVRRFEEAVTTAPPPTPVRVGGAVKAPRQIKRVSPEYPVAALKAGQQGVVILEATIGINGKVSDVKVLRSIPPLDSAAVEAVRQWEYAPTILDEVAVPVITSVAVEFKLTAPPPVRVGGTIKTPEQTKRVNPPYPPEAQAAGVQGVVIMEATVGVDGKVTNVRVLRSIPLLDQVAMDAVRQWEYAPTVVNGVTVPVVMTVTVNFALTPAAPPPVPPPAK